MSVRRPETLRDGFGAGWDGRIVGEGGRGRRRGSRDVAGGRPGPRVLASATRSRANRPTCGSRSPTRTVAFAAWLATALCMGGPLPGLAQTPAASVPGDLTTLFEIGGLVLDTNGDEVPDFVNASLVTGEVPTPAETRAAAEIAARLGFETMALDLPVARGTAAEGVLIAVGRSGWPPPGWFRRGSTRRRWMRGRGRWWCARPMAAAGWWWWVGMMRGWWRLPACCGGLAAHAHPVGAAAGGCGGRCARGAGGVGGGGGGGAALAGACARRIGRGEPSDRRCAGGGGRPGCGGRGAARARGRRGSPDHHRAGRRRRAGRAGRAGTRRPACPRGGPRRAGRPAGGGNTG